jgi:hypothetical protein
LQSSVRLLLAVRPRLVPVWTTPPGFPAADGVDVSAFCCCFWMMNDYSMTKK